MWLRRFPRSFPWMLVLVLLLTALAAGCGDDDDDSSADDDAADDDAADDDQVDDDQTDDDQADDDAEPDLLVGAGRVDITPDFPVIMGGYGMYFLTDLFCRWSTGVHDPLYATAVMIDDGHGQAVMHIVLDVIGALEDDVEAIKALVVADTGLPANRILISATHTHGSPDTVGIYGVMLPPQTGRDPEFIEQMIAGARLAAWQAFEFRRPAVARVNEGLEPNYHFNHVAGDGFFEDPNAMIDDTMTVLAFNEPDGTPIATITNWACHPTTQNNDTTLLSADWVGLFYEKMDTALGGVNMFINGNLGASVRARNAFQPFTVDAYEGWGTWEEVDGMAAGVAQSAMNLIDTAVEIEDPTIEFVNGQMAAPLQNPLLALMGKLGLIAHDVPATGEDYIVPLAAYRFGPLTLATAPGEVVPTIGLELREIMDGEYRMIANLTIDWIGYVLTRSEFYNVLVYAENSMVCAGPATGDALIEGYENMFAPAE